MKNTVGKNIVKLRKEQGMSQEQLAQKLHVTRQAVSNWETGRSQPDLDMLEALASAFETDILVVIYGQMPAGEDEETRSAVRKRHLKKAVFWGILTLASYLILTALGRHLDVLKTRTYKFHALYPAADIRHASYKYGICCQPDACAECGRHCTDNRVSHKKKTSCGGRTVSRTLHALYAVAVCPPSVIPGSPPVDLAHVLFRYPPYPVFFHRTASLPRTGP